MSPGDLGGQTKDPLLVSQEEEEFETPSGNDLLVLEALASSFEDAGAVSFQGIRRKLGLHQETLSRSLHRLERDGFVGKINSDYVVSTKGASVLNRSRAGVSHSSSSFHESFLPTSILRTILPPNATELELEQALSHKWFGNLRWYGSSHGEEGTILSWTTDDGKLRLSAVISDGYLSVESQATTKKSMEEAIRAAYEIFDHVSRVFKYRDLNAMRQNSLHQAA